MKKVKPDTILKIEDFVREFGNLPHASIEKDFIVFDAMQIINSLPKNEFFTPVFCGGTCLSKAYNLLERMSEDVDFKIIPTEAGLELGRDARRKKLSQFAKDIVAALEAGGFGLNSIVRRARDENKYCALEVEFSTSFDKPESLRPHLLLELNYTTLARPSIIKPVGLLLDRLMGISPFLCESFDMECVSLPEAVAEKLISFPRRFALHLNRENPTFEAAENWDISLVRHLYDVHQICASNAICPGNPDIASILSLVIEKDAREFANQHSAFVADPQAELIKAITLAKKHPKIRQQYNRFVADMVYGENTPSFDVAIGVFWGVLMNALGAIRSDDTCINSHADSSTPSL